MAQSILVFDFGTNEEAAQQARHKIEGWQHGSRLGKKLLLKFNREESSRATTAQAAPAVEEAAAASKSGTGKSAAAVSQETPTSRIRLLVRLDFSDHEKLTQQRWLDRMAAEEPFKSAKGETIRQGQAAFAETAELFETLD